MSNTPYPAASREIAPAHDERVDPFASPKLHAQIHAELARVEATWQQWLAEPEGSYADRLVQHLVDAFDAHAKIYLEAVQTQERISLYLVLLRNIATQHIRNAETRGPLRPCYDDDHLRRIAAASFEFLANKNCMSAEQQEAELQNAAARLRIVYRNKAEESLAFRLDLRHRMETRFEARYLHWKAEAISRVVVADMPRDHTAAGGAIGSAEQVEIAEKNTELGTVACSVPSRGAPGHTRYPQSRLQPSRWEDVEITFTSDKRLQVFVDGKSETYGYAELGLDDRRTGNPNRAWETLVSLAECGGSIRTAEGAERSWPKVEKRIQSLREFLRRFFLLPDDPLPLCPGQGYRALFSMQRHRGYNT